MDLADLVLELFIAAQEAQPSDGLAFERAMTGRLHGKGIPLESIPGGSRLYGFPSESGLAHQLDLVVALHGADAIVELKAHRAAMPKNELLRFKAATDDYYVGLGRDLPKRPIYRIFGGPGQASYGMRRYAALNGIGLVEGDRWPSCTLGSDLVWPVDVGGPSLGTRRSLQRLVRPMQQVLRPVSDGYLAERWPTANPIEAALEMQDEWSHRLWMAIDSGLALDDPALGWWAA